MLRVTLRQLSARLRLFLRSSAKYTPFPKRRPCKALLFSTNLTVGLESGGEKHEKNRWNWYHYVIICNYVPLNIFQHDFNGDWYHIIITYHSTYFNMKWYHFNGHNGHCHHKTWRYRTPAMAPIICDGCSSFSAGAMPQQQLIETRHHIFQTDGLGQRMHDKYDKCIWKKKKKTLEKPVTIWQKVDYKML